ncbi:MAG: NAD-dependent epimerase/dehydratase family protein [Deltaproteobacteria bacterium]|nr:NAD-dependent epimerase/dehydratase family protein [Deltaproteobacteria bacterium]
MKRVLVTGAGGFIGSHLVERCLADGMEVRAFVHYNSRSSWGWLDGSPVRSSVEVVAGDVRDFDSVRAATQGVDVVFHLAALIGIPYSYVSPLAYIQTNVVGTYNVLQAAREEGLSQVLVTSTSETYGSAQYVPIDERHPAVGQSPYAATKVAADQLALSYHKSFGLPVKVVRPFNTFGPRQSARAIIPTIMTQAISGSGVVRIGSLTPTRDLTYVADTVSGFLAIAECDALVGQAVNIGTGQEISVGTLAARIIELSGTGARLEPDSRRVRPDASEVTRLLADTSLLSARTGWKPQHTLDQGLEKTLSWVREHIDLYRSDLYNV